MAVPESASHHHGRSASTRKWPGSGAHLVWAGAFYCMPEPHCHPGGQFAPLWWGLRRPSLPVSPAGQKPHSLQ